MVLASLQVASLFLPFPKIAQATITRTARGTGVEDNISDADLIITNITAATGSSLVVGTGCLQGTVPAVSTIAWTGGTFAKDVGVSNGGHRAEIWSAHNVTGGTQTMTVTWAAACNRKVALISELVPSNVGALASSTSATGTGNTNPAKTASSITCTPNSGATCAWVSALEVGRNNTDAAPTWAVPTTAGQKNGTTLSYAAEGFEIDSGAVTQAASSTMATAATYAMVMVSYTEVAAAATTPQQHQVIIIGELPNRLPVGKLEYKI